jgi:hypothetical protein
MALMLPQVVRRQEEGRPEHAGLAKFVPPLRSCLAARRSLVARCLTPVWLTARLGRFGVRDRCRVRPLMARSFCLKSQRRLAKKPGLRFLGFSAGFGMQSVGFGLAFRSGARRVAGTGFWTSGCWRAQDVFLWGLTFELSRPRRRDL